MLSQIREQPLQLIDLFSHRASADVVDDTRRRVDFSEVLVMLIY